MTTTETTVGAYQLVTLASALSLEVAHPRMKASSHFATMTVAKRLGYSGPNRKLNALVWAANIMVDNNIMPSPSIIRTLADNGYELLQGEDNELFFD